MVKQPPGHRESQQPQPRSTPPHTHTHGREGQQLAHGDTAEVEQGLSVPRSPLCGRRPGHRQSPKQLLFYRSGAGKTSTSPACRAEPRVCLVIAKVIATFSVVFQNEANLTLLD